MRSRDSPAFPLVERRRSIRFQLRCEVNCTWRDELGLTNTLKGVTYDISAGGLFITSSQTPWTGSLVAVDINLPGRGTMAVQLQLRGTGRVVRVLQNGARSGFAVAGTPGWSIGRSKPVAAKAS
jgi:c-di-GMP-binding flagellar brake protein YcgR